MKSRLLTILTVFACLLWLAFSPGNGRSDSDVKNIIIMIGDGMGYNHVAAASFFRFGEAGGQVYAKFPVKLAMSTYPHGRGYDPVMARAYFTYVLKNPTDSAAAATAISTGVKTVNRIIGMDANGKRLKHLLELAEERGKATGVVTSVQISHATPAAFVAHNTYRYNYEEIAREMIMDSATDVIMGAGHPLYDESGKALAGAGDYKYVGGKETWDGLIAGKIGGDADADGKPDPWALVQTRAEFRNLISGATPRRVIGVALVRRTLQQERDGNADDDLPYSSSFVESVPSLAEMTLAALNVLDEDPDGFVLVIEGGAIDWAGEDNQNGRMIEEQIGFDEAAESVAAWVEEHSNWEETILIITADHETGYLTGPGSGPTLKPLKNNGRSKLPGMEWRSMVHTNSLVPIYAKGKDAGLLQKYADENDPARGPYMDNTELAHFVIRLLAPSAEKTGAPRPAEKSARR